MDKRNGHCDDVRIQGFQGLARHVAKPKVFSVL